MRLLIVLMNGSGSSFEVLVLKASCVRSRMPLLRGTQRLAFLHLQHILKLGKKARCRAKPSFQNLASVT